MSDVAERGIPEVRRPEGRGHELLCDDGFRRASRAGRAGVIVRVRLTSYRSLPLSCIADVGLSIDGQAVAKADMTFLLDNHAYSFSELPERTDLWWFVLDPAEWFVPLDHELDDGEHLVEGSMREIVPYATGGKTTRSHTCTKRLRLESGEQARQAGTDRP